MMIFYMVAAALFVVIWVEIIEGQVPIPSKLDGFAYKTPRNGDSVMIEAFFDPVCPDSRDSWPPLKQALRHYSSSAVYLLVHPFPLPYHDNAFVASRALHVVNKLNASATYELLESFFTHQEKEFYNIQTFNMSKASIVKRVAKLASKAVGTSYYPAIKSGLQDRATDLATRISVKYGCSRGVFGTPFFFVNGFALPTAGSTRNYTAWRSIINPLVAI